MNFLTHLADVARTDWDALVIGAGPAGALAARQAALRGLDTLLVEAKLFPRNKVCGGCLNQRAVGVLQQCGLAGVVEDCNAQKVDALQVIAGPRIEQFPLPTGRVVCRATFDARLAESAVAAGATFVTGVQAVVQPGKNSGWRIVEGRCRGETKSWRARIVLCADGLSRSSVKRLPGLDSLVEPGSRVGIGTIARDSGALCPPGQIRMIVTSHGYVGLTRVDTTKIAIAAATDPDLLRSAPAGNVVAQMLRVAGIHLPESARSADWHGTPPLTSRPTRVADHRLFVIGDAGGYVEPFTGEGMAAALESATTVVPLAAEACKGWHDSLAGRWEEIHRRVVRGRQTTCRRLAWTLRHPVAVAAALTLYRWFPSAARRVIQRVNQPSPPCRSAEMSPL